MGALRHNRSGSFALDVSRGAIPGVVGVDVFGRNPGIAGTAEDVWAFGGTRVMPTSQGALTSVSSNVNDTAAGTGMRQVTVNYLDAAFASKTLTVTFNGTTNVVSAETDVYRVLNIDPAETGSVKASVGALTFSVGGATQAQIAAGGTESRLTHYTVPAGCYGFIERLFFNCARSAEIQVILFYREPSVGAWRVIRQLQVNVAHVAVDVPSIGPFEPGTDFKMTAESLSGGSGREVGAGYNLLLVEGEAVKLA